MEVPTYSAPLDADTRARFIVLCHRLSERAVVRRYGIPLATIFNLKKGKAVRLPTREKVVAALREHDAEIHDGEGPEFDSYLVEQVNEHARISATVMAKALLLQRGEHGEGLDQKAERLARAAIFPNTRRHI